MNEVELDQRMNELRKAAQAFHEIDIDTYEGTDPRSEILRGVDPESYMIGMAHAFGLNRQAAIAAFLSVGYRKCDELRRSTEDERNELRALWNSDWG